MTNDDTNHQSAQGDYIAQASGGSIAVVNVNPESYLTPAELRNRKDMLLKIKIRAERKLEDSVYNQIIPLDLEYWYDVVVRTEDIEYSEKIEDDIVKCFEQSSGRLLILGEPGSGKTTLLSYLAKSLAEKAFESKSEGIPVILNLFTWHRQKRNLRQWIIEELFEQYDVSGSLAKKWLANDQITLLLDGLDEVPKEHRARCIQEINDYRINNHVQLVVCSREHEYAEIEENLRLQSAVLIRPLPQDQVRAHLLELHLDKLASWLTTTESLNSLSQNPLFLDLLIRIYSATPEDRFVNTISTSDDMQINADITQIDSLKNKIFAIYLQKMIDQRFCKIIEKQDKDKAELQNTDYINKQIKLYIEPLRWIAHQMSRSNEQVLLFEYMQPYWLEERRERYSYYVWAFTFATIIGGAVLGLFSWLTSDRSRTWIDIFLTSCGSIMSIVYFAVGAPIQPIQKVSFSWSSVVRGIRLLSNAGFFLGLTILASSTSPSVDILPELFGVATGFLAMWFTAGIIVYAIWKYAPDGKEAFLAYFIFERTPDKRKISMQSFFFIPRLNVRFLLFAISMVVMPLLVLLDRFVNIINDRLAISFSTIVAYGVIGVILGGLGLGMFFGLKSETVGIDQGVNQGMKRNLKIALIGGSMTGIGAFIVIFMVIMRLIDVNLNIPQIIFISTYFAGTFAYIGFLKLGGLALIQHYTLRILLARYGYLPIRLKRLLHIGVEISFLRYTGRGYEFIHKDFMEYLANIHRLGRYSDDRKQRSL